MKATGVWQALSMGVVGAGFNPYYSDAKYNRLGTYQSMTSMPNASPGCDPTINPAEYAIAWSNLPASIGAQVMVTGATLTPMP